MVYKKIKEAKEILAQKSGISILFVLAVMMLLMAVGISTLVAASTAVGSGVTAWKQNQLEAYSDSMIKTFTANLQSEVKGDYGMAMIDQIKQEFAPTNETEEAKKTDRAEFVYAAGIEKSVEVSFKGFSDDMDQKTDDITLGFPEGVFVTNTPAITTTVGGVDVELPRIITIKGFPMTMTIETTFNNETIKMQVKYRYSGATYTTPPATDELPEKYGTWEVIRYGKIS